MAISPPMPPRQVFLFGYRPDLHPHVTALKQAQFNPWYTQDAHAQSDLALLTEAKDQRFAAILVPSHIERHGGLSLPPLLEQRLGEPITLDDPVHVALGVIYHIRTLPQHNHSVIMVLGDGEQDSFKYLRMGATDVLNVYGGSQHRNPVVKAVNHVVNNRLDHAQYASGRPL